MSMTFEQTHDQAVEQMHRYWRAINTAGDLTQSPCRTFYLLRDRGGLAVELWNSRTQRREWRSEYMDQMAAIDGYLEAAAVLGY